MINKSLKEFLDQKVRLYNQPSFIATDPISVPRSFTCKEDIEIAGFLAATIAWGQRTTIVANACRMVSLMKPSPHEFIMTFGEKELQPFAGFVHRTFNFTDLSTFFYALKNIYQQHGGLEKVFTDGFIEGSAADAISGLRDVFFKVPHSLRTRKHVSNPLTGASAKRLNMYLRWLVRKDDAGVDFGLWQGIDPACLVCPLDLHSGRVARALGLLTRKQDDWKAVEELTENLRQLDPADPVKYDFALFGLGVFEKFG